MVETGKIHTYAQFCNAAAKNGVTIPIKLKNNMLASIDNGKNNVTNAMNKASALSPEFVNAKAALQTLQSKYDAYYNYIKSTPTPDAYNCLLNYQACEKALKDLSSAQFTSSYNSNDKRLANNSFEKNAYNFVSTGYTAFNKLRGAFSQTSLNYSDTAYNVIAANYSTFEDTVSATYKVKAYGLLMGDDVMVKSNYEALYNRLKTYINLSDYVGEYNKFYNAG